MKKDQPDAVQRPDLQRPIRRVRHHQKTVDDLGNPGPVPTTSSRRPGSAIARRSATTRFRAARRSARPTRRCTAPTTRWPVARSDYNHPYNPVTRCAQIADPLAPCDAPPGRIRALRRIRPAARIRSIPTERLNLTRRPEWFSTSPTAKAPGFRAHAQHHRPQATSAPAAYNDGNDRTFGDTGNDRWWGHRPRRHVRRLRQPAQC